MRKEWWCFQINVIAWINLYVIFLLTYSIHILTRNYVVGIFSCSLLTSGCFNCKYSDDIWYIFRSLCKHHPHSLLEKFTIDKFLSCDKHTLWFHKVTCAPFIFQGNRIHYVLNFNIQLLLFISWLPAVVDTFNHVIYLNRSRKLHT